MGDARRLHAAAEGASPGDDIDAAAREQPRPSPKPLGPGLYIVATPIGNMGDITLRALDVLRGVDLIACEDTRVTAPFLARLGVKTPLAPYHEHNAEAARPKLLARLAEGGKLALVSDAGTPLVSDPGYKLVRAALAQGSAVVPIPGASAVTAALSVAGLPTDRFLFLGFLPPKAAARRQAIAEIAAVRASLVLLEAPHRLAETLADLAELLGPRAAAVARELTKLHEEVRRGTLDELARHYAGAGAPKGEITLVIAPPEQGVAPALDAEALLARALETMSPAEAAKAVAAATGRPKREIYALALAAKRDS
ncbi:16S rRNA (cytidine(1402)-2'-O)-methyltransferase [Desertibaculum subflavum]|uniref:16S rRNA (cytidine(1402)-2'-O)-methyltransferase n=1 Tax=Desertibaculum subflavum TaxID=2268458 RepID=UPI000E666775